MAILGSPVAGALSPVIHRAAYAELGLDWTYEAVECSEDGIAQFLAEVRADERWAGLSLTMPVKRAALSHLDEVSAVAALTGAVNTVVADGGRLFGENTDVAGMERAIGDAGGGSATSVAVLGAGATAATALCVAKGLGMAEALVVVRDPARAGALRAAADRMGMGLRVVPWSELRAALKRDLVISALPPFAADRVGMSDLAGFTGTLLDVAYRPSPTTLVANALRAGAAAVDGLSMLVHQAARQLELQVGSGVRAPYQRMYQAACDALAAPEARRSHAETVVP